MDSCSGDCDDSNPSIYLNASENCNGLDDDCDGSTDEEDAIDKSEWYQDGDGDGFGNGGVSLFACDQPVGFIAVSGDCNDGDSSISPNATEVCDGLDNNCDGLSDDADANVDLNTATEFFQDADFDGFGNPLQSTFACNQLPGFVTNSDDCDDGNLLRNPNGFEYCNNIDDNCDGTIDELAVDATTYFVDSDGDGHGSLVDVSNGYDLISCPTFDAITNLPVNPTGYAQSNDDCDDGNATISPSANERCTNGIDENCDGHNTAGATDVTTFLVDADGDTFGSGERDSNGDLAYALDLCIQPYGYVPYAQGDGLDCDDGDFDVKPGAVELCNGQLDNCASDINLNVPTDEVDDDGDGHVECTLDVDPLQWADLTAGIVGGDDCDDNDINAYPDAPELCNGAFEDCNDPLYIAQSQSAPDDEIDDDGDCFVECYGFNSNTWEGGAHTCEHVDSVGQIVQETVVIGGEDCNDDNPDTYVGAAYNDPTICAQDADGDGDADCNLVGLVGVNTNYFCDFGVDLPNGGMGPDFVLIQGGLEPKGRYTLTNDFYVMTTEVTQQMWTDVMSGSGYGHTPNFISHFGVGSLYPAYDVSWYDALAFANRLSVLTGREECYANMDDPNIDYQQQYDPDGLSPAFTKPYDCNGFRLLTSAEWEYAARSGTTSEFWTGQGSQLGGTYSSQTSTGNETILDGVNNPLLRDYAWYSGNNDNQYGVYGSKEVGQKLPNGFGLYDMHGNLSELNADGYVFGLPSPTGTDPYFEPVDHSRQRRGSCWSLGLGLARVSSINPYTSWYTDVNLGFRLGLTSP
jgi:formylglycine-generating enzyme required for sulfatase activity